MKDEYIIINKTPIQKRIEELENKQKKFKNLPHNPISTYNALQYEINIYKQILSQSTPLIPILETTWGKAIETVQGTTLPEFNNLSDYISNLKLDI